VANNYTQGTVDPFLPLNEIQHRLITEHNWDEEYEDPQLEEVAKEIWGEERDEALNLEAEKGWPGSGAHYLFFPESTSEMGLTYLEWLIRQPNMKDIPYITVEFAHTCSKMRPGEFGGGAWFITREGVESVHTGSWLGEQVRAMSNPPEPAKILNHLECCLEVVNYAGVSITVECTEHGEVVETLWEKGAENDDG
jgi:hypothetical protein